MFLSSQGKSHVAAKSQAQIGPLFDEGSEPPDGFSLSIVALHESLISVHKQLCGDEVFFHVVNNLFNI